MPIMIPWMMNVLQEIPISQTIGMFSRPEVLHKVEHRSRQITPKDLHTSKHNSPGLHGERDGVRTTPPCMLRSLLLNETLILVLSLLLSDKLSFVLLNVFFVPFPKLAVLEICFKFLSGPGLVAETFTRNATERIGNGNQEIGGGLTIGGFVSHIHKVFLGSIGRTEICQLALVNDSDLVENLVQVLAGLINGDDGGKTIDIGGNA